MSEDRISRAGVAVSFEGLHTTFLIRGRFFFFCCEEAAYQRAG